MPDPAQHPWPSESEPLVSIITLNYNQPEVTCQFLESSRNLLYKNFEILVADMASDINPTEMIQAGQYPNTRVFLSDQNLGFAGGNNWAMRQAKGDYYFIVNNDTSLTPDLIGLLLEPFYNNPRVGVSCPKIKYFYYPNIIQYAGFNRMDPFTGRTSTIGDMQEDLGQFDEAGPTFGAHGCAMMVKKDVALQTGMFPEKFFLYYEEWDWSMRIRQKGFVIWYTPAATIFHKESMSVGKKNPMKVYYHTRNRILFMRRNSDPLHLLVFYLFFVFITVPKSLATYLAHRQTAQLRLFVKAICWNMHSSSRSKV